MRRGGRALLAVAAAAALLAPSTAAAPAPRASLPDIEDEVMCPICGTLLELSDAPQADRERRLIRELIAQGKTKAQIKDELVAEYGPEILATPSGHGFDLLAWIVPGLAIALALCGIGFALARQRATSSAPGGPPSEPDPSELAELERDMSSYDI
ncbi:MAG: cytochrome c-type biogenesis protein CcmH [Solirubrobacterales bacterium]